MPGYRPISPYWPIFAYLFIYLFIQHLLARPKTANKHERSGDSQPRQAKRLPREGEINKYINDTMKKLEAYPISKEKVTAPTQSTQSSKPIS